jgi:hypothetical protein
MMAGETAAGLRATDWPGGRLVWPTTPASGAGQEEIAASNRLAGSWPSSIRPFRQIRQGRREGEGRIPPSWPVKARPSQATAAPDSCPAQQPRQRSSTIRVVGGSALRRAVLPRRSAASPTRQAIVRRVTVWQPRLPAFGPIRLAHRLTTARRPLAQGMPLYWSGWASTPIRAQAEEGRSCRILKSW